MVGCGISGRERMKFSQQHLNQATTHLTETFASFAHEKKNHGNQMKERDIYALTTPH